MKPRQKLADNDIYAYISSKMKRVINTTLIVPIIKELLKGTQNWRFKYSAPGGI